MAAGDPHILLVHNYSELTATVRALAASAAFRSALTARAIVIFLSRAASVFHSSAATRSSSRLEMPCRSRRILARVDGGRCSFAAGAGPQFVSEVWYGPNDTTHGNVGDSWCSMARIALFDARARKRVCGAAAVAAVDASLAKLIEDLLHEIGRAHV